MLSVLFLPIFYKENSTKLTLISAINFLSIYINSQRIIFRGSRSCKLIYLLQKQNVEKNIFTDSFDVGNGVLKLEETCDVVGNSFLRHQNYQELDI